MNTRHELRIKTNDTNKKGPASTRVRSSTRGGFTLIEIMVASSIFIIVMFISIGAVLSLVDGNRRARAVSSVVSNLNISLDSMVRDIRTGTEYQILVSDKITFFNSDNNQTIYSLVQNGTSYSIHKNVEDSSHNSLIDGNITAPEVAIDNMSFVGKGVGTNDRLQPLILLQIRGKVGIGKYVSPFTIQTLISQRVLDD